MVVFATVSGLLWQALGTLARVERRLADSRLFATEEALRAEWVRQALRGMVGGAQGDPLRPQGSATQLRAYSSSPPWPRSLGPEPMELVLRTEPDGSSLLVALRPGADGAEWRLWSWPGAGRFGYLDRSGNWHDEWPPFLGVQAAAGAPPMLPQAVRLTGPPGGMLLVAVPAGDNPMLRRADLEKQ